MEVHVAGTRVGVCLGRKRSMVEEVLIILHEVAGDGRAFAEFPRMCFAPVGGPRGPMRRPSSGPQISCPHCVRTCTRIAAAISRSRRHCRGLRDSRAWESMSSNLTLQSRAKDKSTAPPVTTDSYTAKPVLSPSNTASSHVRGARQSPARRTVPGQSSSSSARPVCDV